MNTTSKVRLTLERGGGGQYLKAMTHTFAPRVTFAARRHNSGREREERTLCDVAELNFGYLMKEAPISRL